MTTPLPIVEGASTSVCALWIAPEEAFDCCPDLEQSDTAQMEWAIQQASEILYRLSGSRYPGICSQTVRPAAEQISCWAPRWPVWPSRRDVDCRPVSKIRLAGYPIQSIVEVVIGGVVVDASAYELRRNRELARIDGERWPVCNDGTFFVTYEYGQNPPLSGIAAAGQLACEIAKACPGSDGSIEDCALPEGTVRITRQGLTIDTQALGLWLIGQMRTGMPLVDAFLATWGSRARRRVALSVPEMDPWPLRVGS